MEIKWRLFLSNCLVKGQLSPTVLLIPLFLPVNLKVLPYVPV